MDRYAMYLRKSRADLDLEAIGEAETLARHKQRLLDLAAKMDIRQEQIDIYHEIVSGESISSRPAMQRLLQAVYQKQYTGVFVVEVERLARGNTKDQGEVADAFQFSNTLIITPIKTYNPNNEYDQEFFEFGLFMSRREYKTIKRRMEAGRMQSIAEGNYVGSKRPYGYDIQRISKKERILVENKDESTYVRMIFDWFTLDRKSAGWIARKLTEMHVPTLTGNAEWNRGTVKDILQNVHYIGKVRWNRRKCSKEYDADAGTLSKKKRRLTPSDYLVYQGKHKPIISEEQFTLAQSLFDSQIPVKANENVANPLSGLMYCAKCGKAISFQAYSTRSNTASRYVHRESSFCKMASVNAAVLMEALVDALKAYISDCEITLQNASESIERDRIESVVKLLTEQLEKQQRKRERLFDAFEDGTYTNEEFIERKQNLNSVIEDIKRQIEELKESVPQSVDYRERIVTVHHVLESLNDPSVDAKRKNILLKSIINRIDFESQDLGRMHGAIPILDVHFK